MRTSLCALLLVPILGTAGNMATSACTMGVAEVCVTEYLDVYCQPGAPNPGCPVCGIEGEGSDPWDDCPHRDTCHEEEYSDCGPIGIGNGGNGNGSGSSGGSGGNPGKINLPADPQEDLDNDGTQDCWKHSVQSTKQGAYNEEVCQLEGADWAPPCGVNLCRRRHNGRDIPCNVGDTVRSGTRGVVTRINRKPEADKEAGLYVEIDTPDGSRRFQYLHLSSITAGLDVGSSVGAGAIIGQCGATGNATGPHLHLGIGRPRQSPPDPPDDVFAYVGLCADEVMPNCP